MHVKNIPGESFVYLCSREICCVLNMCCIISVLFSTGSNLYHGVIFFCSNSMFFIKFKFRYQPGHLKIKAGSTMLVVLYGKLIPTVASHDA
jgi:hypothetical protein